MAPRTPRDRLALALDNSDTIESVATMVAQTSEFIGVYKIGLELFVKFGPAIIDVVRKSDSKIFLDLKFHDIPNTVAQAVTAACGYSVDYLTIHTQGGKAMMEAAQKAAQASAHPPSVLGVTILTSLSQQALDQELRVGLDVSSMVKHLATLAMKSGLGGIVCSAADLPHVRPVLPASCTIVTPGIRLPENEVNDQQRIATPGDAINNGATLLVIGRPITQAAHPAKAAEQFLRAVEN